MANRITWQNVVAPDFGSAIDGMDIAGRMFGRGADTIANALGARDERLRGEDSAAAAARALQIQDAGEWDRLMETQGIAGLGIDPRRASAALLSLAQGRGDSLFASEKADYDQARSVLSNQRADKTYQEGEDAKLRLLNAQAQAAGLVAGSTSKDEIRTRTLNDPSFRALGPLEQQARLAAIDGLDEGYWQASDKSMKEAANLQVARGITDHLATEADRMNWEAGADDLQRVYNASTRNFEGSVGDLGVQLVEQIRGKKDTTEDGETQTLYESTAGEVGKLYEKLRTSYPTVPAEVVAEVVRSHVEDSGWIMTGDQLVPAKKKIEATLTKLSDPSALQRLADKKLDLDRNNQALAGAQAGLTEAQRIYALGKERGDQGLMDRALGEMDKIAKSLRVADPRLTAQGSGPTADAFLGPLSMGAPAPTDKAVADAELERAAQRIEQEKARQNRPMLEVQNQRSQIIQELQDRLKDRDLSPRERSILVARLQEFTEGQAAIEGMIRR